MAKGINKDGAYEEEQNYFKGERYSHPVDHYLRIPISTLVFMSVVTSLTCLLFLELTFSSS